MSQTEIPNPYLSIILYIFYINLTQFILKTLVLNKYLGIIAMVTLFQGSLFSACDVTAWAREAYMKVGISFKPLNIKP